MIDVTCPECGEIRQLQTASSLVSPCRKCANNIRHEKFDITCLVCSKVFTVPLNRVKKNAKFCSQKCVGVYMQKSRRGKKNPAYKHGRNMNVNIRGFNLRAKGEESCRRCGLLAINLHHAIPRSQWQAGKRDLRNGLPLCAKCHTRWHAGHREIYRDCFTKEEWDFLSSAELLGKVTEAWLDDHYPSRPPGL